MIITKGNKALSKTEFPQSLTNPVSYNDLVIADQCVGGESSLDLTAVTTPTIMQSTGFSNPSTANILASNILFNKRNVELLSVTRGPLIQGLHYVINTASKIDFVGFNAEPDEIFIIRVKSMPINGLMVVDGKQTVNTGTLSSGQTDFAVDPFEYMKFPSKQSGAAVVYRNGIQQFRCEDNNIAKEGDYIEVNNGTGLTNVIRFKTASSGNDSVAVLSLGTLVEKPSASMLLNIETLAGQNDKIIATLAQLAGKPITDFYSAPNSVDLASFGTSVINLSNALSAEIARVRNFPDFCAQDDYTDSTPAALGTYYKHSFQSTGILRDNRGAYSNGDYLIKEDGIYEFSIGSDSGGFATNSAVHLFINVNGPGFITGLRQFTSLLAGSSSFWTGTSATRSYPMKAGQVVSMQYMAQGSLFPLRSRFMSIRKTKDL